jgi:GNAT superfamily N-acetyltransferase
MADIDVREAVAADLPQIATVALAAGQDGEWSGADGAYMSHLLAVGRVVVGTADGSVVGFGATRQLGSGPGAVSMLCDLFVDPRAHGTGCGRAILARLWPGRARRMTFSSLHGNALPLYTSFGLDAWWPLLYLRGRVGALTVPGAWRASVAAPSEVAALELAWTGVDRSADHVAWARRPGGTGVLVRRGDQVVAAAAVGGAGGEYGVTHLMMAPSVSGGDVVAAVLAVVAGLDGEDGQARVCLPAPHPAVRVLLAAGWRVEEFDLYMATEPGFIDPRQVVPSPALA